MNIIVRLDNSPTMIDIRKFLFFVSSWPGFELVHIYIYMCVCVFGILGIALMYSSKI